MNLFVADPHWRWLIVFYFYLGGIAAGVFFVSMLVELMGPREDRGVARIGYRLALPLIVVCGILLIVDLDHPSRFWHMLFRSEAVHAAMSESWPWTAASWQHMAHAPLIKLGSPMSVGSWALTVFGVCSFLMFWISFSRPTGGGRHILGIVLRLFGCIVGFFVAAYTGALLTATNQPVWSDSVWIASLFLTSATSTGLAMLVLLGRRACLSEASMARLDRADVWALGLELVMIMVFLASLGSHLLPVMCTPSGLLLIVGTLLVGIFLPLALHLDFGFSRAIRRVLAAILVLAGGFVMRYAILTTPHELLARGRVPIGQGDHATGGESQDPTNAIRPRSKVFGE